MIQFSSTSVLHRFFTAVDPESFLDSDFSQVTDAIAKSDAFDSLIRYVIDDDVYSAELSHQFQARDGVAALPAYRMLRTALNMTVESFLTQIGILARCFDPQSAAAWFRLANSQQSAHGCIPPRMIDVFQRGPFAKHYQTLEQQLPTENPHAIYPTTPYRDSMGDVVASDDFQQVEAVMTSRTSTSIRIVERVLSPHNSTLSDIYAPLGRCVCVIDANVHRHYGEQVESYFGHHGIDLEVLVYRAMEIDKGIATVERLLGDFKILGVSRDEPVLVIGGGVLSDTAGLACSLYHRGTPYVMLSSSLVAGIDAGPSPRTCCDGFGFKNLFGAYHTPVLSITDRTMFATLRAGWLRHGIAEIIKMAVVKDLQLFNDLDAGGRSLIRTRFGSVDTRPDDPINHLSQQILGRAIKSYVEAEYGNLYETHQCRPHAYGHTWSPGFEIPAGLLHGHAVAIGMGLGAMISLRQGWIDADACDRIHRIIMAFDLSLWHDILDDHETIYVAQQKMIEKRGGNLAAPLPRGAIGRCGYLHGLDSRELSATIDDYKRLCRSYARGGCGIEPLCSDVGLESAATVGCSDNAELMTR